MLTQLLQDIRYGTRALLRNRSFAVIALLTLTLGIGAMTAIFSVVDAVLLRPLPYRDPQRLVSIFEDFSKVGVPHNAVTPGTYADMKTHKQIFEDVAAIDTHADNLVTGNGSPEGMIAGEVTHNLFSMLGIKPLFGRVFLPEEEIPGNDHVALLGYPLWQRRFASDPRIVGQSVRINDQAYTVIGVMPRGFSFPSNEVELWTPRFYTAQDLVRHWEHYLTVLARLQAGVSLQKANADLQILADQTVQRYPNEEAPGLSRFFAEPLRDSYTHDVQRGLTMLMAAVGFILLIACANMANLLLARAAGRQREIAMRAALGANRARILRQLLTESTLLAIGGGLLGILFALGSFAFLKHLVPEDLSRTVSLSLNLPVLAFTVVISFGSSFLFGLVPALQNSKLDLNDVLKEGGRGSAGSRHKRLGDLFIIGEVALSLMLLAGASFLVKSLWNLQHVDPGFRSSYLLTGSFHMSEPKYKEFAQRTQFFEQTLARIRTLPGVQSAGLTSVVPLVEKSGRAILTTEEAGTWSEVPYTTNQRVITPGYFETMEIPLIRGRLFDDRDKQDAPLTAIVNQTFAQELWPHQDAIGKRFRMGRPSDGLPWIQVVGVIGDVKQMGLNEPPRQEVYFPYLQSSGNWMQPNSIVVRTNAEPMSMLHEIQHAVAEIYPNQPLSHVMTMDDILDHETLQSQIQTILLSSLAALALIMACVGIYGVMAYMVAQRTNEMGVRMALGAQRGHVLGLVLGRGMTLTLIGMTVGVSAALALTRLMRSLLFDVSPTDPVILTGVSVLLIVVALMACLIPARRAASVDPVQALRAE